MTRRLSIEIECDNAAFSPRAGVELQGILRGIALVLGGLTDSEIFGSSRWTAQLKPVRDVNGNVVGSLTTVVDDSPRKFR